MGAPPLIALLLGSRNIFYDPSRSGSLADLESDRALSPPVTGHPVTSDNGTVDGSTAPHSFTARGRTHQGGSLADLESDRALSPPVTGHPVASHQSPSHWATYLRSSSHRSSSRRSTNHQSTSHQSTRLQSTRHWFTVIHV